MNRFPADDSVVLSICAFAPLADALRLAMTARHCHHILWVAGCGNALPGVLAVASGTRGAALLTPARLDRLIARFGAGLRDITLAASSLRRGESMEIFATRFPTLRSFTLHSCESTSFSSVKVDAASVAPPMLSQLCVEGAARLRPPILSKFVAPGCLRELRITGAPLMDTAILRALVKARPPLTRLELVECGSLDEDTLLRLLAIIAPTLVALDLSGCSGFGAVATAMPRLEHLRLACCPSFSSAGVRALGDVVLGCARLTSLDLRRCPRALADGGSVVRLPRAAPIFATCCLTALPGSERPMRGNSWPCSPHDRPLLSAVRHDLLR